MKADLTVEQKKIVVVGAGYVGFAMAVLLARKYPVTAVDTNAEKVEKINRRESPIQDNLIEEYLKEKDLFLTATTGTDYRDASFVVISVPTDYASDKNCFDSSLVDSIPFVDSKMIIEALYKYEGETIFIVNIYSLENLLKNHNEVPSVDIQALFPQDNASKALMMKRTGALVVKASQILSSWELQVKNKYISFNLDKDYYCIALDYVKEVLKDTTITNVPGTPEFIEGIMNLRGDYITVINLKKFLSLPESEAGEKKPVIIIRGNELELALYVDKINEIFDFQESENVENSESYYSSEFIYNKTLYTVLNIDKIVSDKTELSEIKHALGIPGIILVCGSSLSGIFFTFRMRVLCTPLKFLF